MTMAIRPTVDGGVELKRRVEDYARERDVSHPVAWRQLVEAGLKDEDNTDYE